LVVAYRCQRGFVSARNPDAICPMPPTYMKPNIAKSMINEGGKAIGSSIVVLVVIVEYVGRWVVVLEDVKLGWGIL